MAYSRLSVVRVVACATASCAATTGTAQVGGDLGSGTSRFRDVVLGRNLNIGSNNFNQVQLGYNETTGALDVTGAVARTGTTYTCAAGVLALDPDPAEPFIYIDPDGADCVVTLDDASALLGSGVITMMIIAASGGGTDVTFPDVAGEHEGPALCTTTGLAENGVYQIVFADKAADLYMGVSCIQN